jgi:hypothetical protein
VSAYASVVEFASVVLEHLGQSLFVHFPSDSFEPHIKHRLAIY